MEDRKLICFVCNGDASDNPHPQFDAYPGWQCCKKHAKHKYTPYFMIPFVLKELGLPYKHRLAEMQKDAPGFLKAKLDCNVCHELLTEKEIGRIKSTDANFYCTKHLRNFKYRK